MKSLRRRQFTFFSILVLFLVLFTESMLRFGLKTGLYFPFWRPDRALAERYYRDAYRLRDSTITLTDGYFDILILGGSVVADEWHSTVGQRLRDTLKARTGNPRIRYWNVASLGHSSGDNLAKYRALERQRFDLVLYYEAINETRLNNVPRTFFRPDYTHYTWYDEVQLVEKHPELRVSVVPFTLHLLWNRLQALVGVRRYIREKPDPDDQQHGGDLKTPPCYRRNLDAIRQLARQRNERLLLVNFAYYIPNAWRESGFRTGADYSPCGLSSPMETWGMAQHVESGLLAHRRMMHQLAVAHPEVGYVDMQPVLPKSGRYFCDICHLTDDGCGAFAGALAAHIIRERLVPPPPLLATASTRRP